MAAGLCSVQSVEVAECRRVGCRAIRVPLLVATGQFADLVEKKSALRGRKKVFKSFKSAYWRRRTIRENVVVGQDFAFGINSVLWAPTSLQIGDDVSVGSNVRIEVDGQIGDGVLIANSAALVGRIDHEMHAVGVTIRASRWVGDFPDLLSRSVTIGSDVWIGFGAIVLSGVTIGDSTIVGAGSVVTHSVPPNSIAVGNPATVIGQRFSDLVFEEHWDMLERAGVSRLVR